MLPKTYFLGSDMQLYDSYAALVRREPMPCGYASYTSSFGGLALFPAESVLREVLGFVPKPGEISASLAARIANAPQKMIELAEERKLARLNMAWVTDLDDKKADWSIVNTKPQTSVKASAGEPTFPERHVTDPQL